MILCGSITDSELRARLLSLADGIGWDSWITHDAGLLSPMLEALSTPADAIISDHTDTLAQLAETGAARILIRASPAAGSRSSFSIIWRTSGPPRWGTITLLYFIGFPFFPRPLQFSRAQ